MAECDEGPKRRVSRGRKRTSYSDNNDSIIEKRNLRSNRGSNSKPDDFTSMNGDGFHHKEFTASTPVGKRKRKLSAPDDSMNNSDLMLAELDIDTITSQAISQSQTLVSQPAGKGSGVSENNGKLLVKHTDYGHRNANGVITDNEGRNANGVDSENQNQQNGDSSILNDSNIVVSPTEWQYFVPKFRNYKSTQQLKRKEVVLDNSLLNSSSCQNDNDTSVLSFNISSDTSQADGRCTQTVEILEVSLHDISNKENLVSLDAQSKPHYGFEKPEASQLRNGITINETGDSQCSLSGSGETVVDTTQLKEDGGFKYRCTPYRHKPQYTCTQTQSETQGGLKLRDLCTQTQTQGELMGGTQYKSYLYDTVRSQTQSQFVTCDIKQCDSSQVPSSMVYNMTGVLVETQGDVADNAGNTSGDDLFNDSTSPETGAEAGYKPMNQDAEVTSHTQSLASDDSQKSAQSRRLSFDEDLDSIMMESQSLREKTKSRTANNSGMGLNDTSGKTKTDSSKVDVKTVDNDKGMKRATSEAKTSVIVKDEPVYNYSNIPIKSELNKGGTSFVSSTLHDKGNLSTEKNTTLKTELRSSGSNTPIVAGTLQDKIKKRLQDNAGRRTPQRPGALMEQLREQVLERVKLEAAIKKQEETFKDVGPFYGLPTKVKHLFENYRGIKTLYDWQDECLKLPAVQQRTNLIYSLPTSGGKTLVAEILILREILCHKRDALLILPFVSIVQEKVRNMSQFAVDLNFFVEEYAGSKGRFPPMKRRHNRSLYIATIEKAQSIVNSLIEADRMDNLGLVVVDELHMLGEGGSRGSALEATLMKILHAESTTHIIGMSATLNNIGDLQKFLHAEVYSNDFRPVTLTEYVKQSDSVYKVDSKALCPEDQFVHDRIVCFQYPPDMTKVDPDHLLGLALEVIPNHSCLVFCPTKKNCENVALMLCKLMSKYKRELMEVKRSERKMLLKELYNDCEGKMCPVLQYTLYYGVAYHHSGLTSDERKLIEEAYSNGTLCLLTCTSTLAAGVNLPAKRVILRSPYVGQCFISRSQYKQMVGRAGRAGIDDSGESVLICKASDRERVGAILQGPVENCHSSLLYNAGKGLRTLILSTIGLRITPTTEDVFKFVRRSLAYIQQTVLQTDITEMCKTALQNLIDIGLVVQVKVPSENPQQPVTHSLEVTRLGKATFKGPIDSDYAVMLYEDLKKAEEPLVITTHLHLLYLVTPYDGVKDMSPSWFTYFNQMSHFSSSELKVASLIGVPESYIAKRASQQKSKQKVDEFVVSRFYLTLMLYDLWREKSVWEVAEKYQQTRGFIQNLLSSAASFATCVTHFCAELEEFWAYQDLMGNFVKRLSYCVNVELIPLMEIPGVKLGRARLLHTAGYQSLSAIAAANPKDLVKNVQYMPGKIAHQIVASAKLILNEKAEAMMEEVEALVRVPEGQLGPGTMTYDKTPVSVSPTVSESDLGT